MPRMRQEQLAKALGALVLQVSRNVESSAQGLLGHDFSLSRNSHLDSGAPPTELALGRLVPVLGLAERHTTLSELVLDKELKIAGQFGVAERFHRSSIPHSSRQSSRYTFST